MTVKSVSMGAPFAWFMKALDVGGKNPKALFGGFLILLLVGVLPSLVQLGIEHGLNPSLDVLLTVYGVVMLVSLLLMPPITGSALRLMQNCEMGRPASALDVLDGYRDGGFAVRMILTSLVLLACYVVVFALLWLLMPGKEFMIELFARSAATPPGGQPDMSGMPPFPPSFLLWLLGAFALLMVLTHVYLLAFAQAALGGQGPLAATAQGFMAVLRNVLPFVGFTLVAVIVGMVLLFIVALVLGVVIALLAAASPVLAIAIGAPVYVVVMLGMYVVMFGFYYRAWRDIFGEAAVPPPVADAIVA
jgi:hypothetical protein